MQIILVQSVLLEIPFRSIYSSDKDWGVFKSHLRNGALYQTNLSKSENIMAVQINNK